MNKETDPTDTKGNIYVTFGSSAIGCYIPALHLAKIFDKTNTILVLFRRIEPFVIMCTGNKAQPSFSHLNERFGLFSFAVPAFVTATRLLA